MLISDINNSEILVKIDQLTHERCHLIALQSCLLHIYISYFQTNMPSIVYFDDILLLSQSAEVTLLSKQISKLPLIDSSDYKGTKK